MDTEIDTSSIEDWLPGKEPERLIKFSKRKDANSVRKVKKNLKYMDFSSIGIRSRVHKNYTLCNYKILWQKRSSFSITLRLSDNGRLYIITHISDLEKLFSENEFLRVEK